MSLVCGFLAVTRNECMRNKTKGIRIMSAACERLTCTEGHHECTRGTFYANLLLSFIHINSLRHSPP